MLNKRATSSRWCNKWWSVYLRCWWSIWDWWLWRVSQLRVYGTIHCSFEYCLSWFIFEGEIPQRTHNDIESEDEQLNTKRRKASFSRGANDTEVGRSYATCDPSAPPPLEKNKITIDLNDLANEWDITVEEVREIMMEHNDAIWTRKEECWCIKLAQTLSSANESADV